MCFLMNVRIGVSIGYFAGKKYDKIFFSSWKYLDAFFEIRREKNLISPFIIKDKSLKHKDDTVCYSQFGNEHLF